MSEQKVWPSRELADAVLADVAAVRTYVAGMAHSFAGDDSKETQQALVTVVGELDELAQRIRSRLETPTGLPNVFSDAPPEQWPVVEPGLVTADVVRRMRKNSGGKAKHRAQP